MLFASENMIHLKTTSRKDDLESLIYIMCYLYCGTLPIIEYINKNIDKFLMSKFLDDILKYRIENKKILHEKV
jgi:hypothetical protein